MFTFTAALAARVIGTFRGAPSSTGFVLAQSTLLCILLGRWMKLMERWQRPSMQCQIVFGLMLQSMLLARPSTASKRQHPCI